MNKILGLNFFVFCILSLIIILSREVRNEGFFNNTGALSQLASTRVKSERDDNIDEHLYNNLTRKGIMDMTESGYKATEFVTTS